MLLPIIHIFLHFIVPAIIAKIAYRDRFWKAYLIMISAMLIDMDHLLANPIYDPNRCGIGFHPLHSYFAIIIYFLMTLIPKWRILGIGLLIHIFLDITDCFRIH